MNIGGWIFMLSSIGFVVGLTAYCFYRVLSKPQIPEHLRAPAVIDTRDEGTKGPDGGFGVDLDQT